MSKGINLDHYTDTYETLIKLKRDLKDRPIYVWGAKITGGAVCSVLIREKFENVKGVIDSNTFVQGKKLFGFTVYSPEYFWEISEKSTETPFVIVAAAIRTKEIFDICTAHGLSENTDLCWADDLLGPVYEIDLTNSCNLKCPSCPQSNWTRHENAVMSLERFKRIVGHIKKDTPNIAYIPLFCWTEPLLKRDLPEYVKVLKNEGILGIISTNFSLDVPHLEELIRQKPEYFRISFSGFTQETYERAHRGGNVALVKQNMYKLRDLLDKYSPDTFVEVYYHEYNYSPSEELQAWQKICNKLQYTLFNHNAGINPIENVIRIFKGEDISDIENVLNTLNFDFSDRRYPDICDHPELCYSFKNMFCVTAKGKVLVCDCVYDEKQALLAEDIEKTTYKELMLRKKDNKVCIDCLKYGLPLYSFQLSSNPKSSVRKIYEELVGKE